MLSCVNSTLNGIATIRASEAETLVKQEFDSHQVKVYDFMSRFKIVFYPFRIHTHLHGI